MRIGAVSRVRRGRRRAPMPAPPRPGQRSASAAYQRLKLLGGDQVKVGDEIVKVLVDGVDMCLLKILGAVGVNQGPGEGNSARQGKQDGHTRHKGHAPRPGWRARKSGGSRCAKSMAVSRGGGRVQVSDAGRQGRDARGCAAHARTTKTRKRRRKICPTVFWKCLGNGVSGASVGKAGAGHERRRARCRVGAGRGRSTHRGWAETLARL